MEEKTGLADDLRLSDLELASPLRVTKAGDVVRVEYGRDREGRFWWRSGETMHGPFTTEKKAKDAEATLFGPNCKFKDGVMWDPNWDKKQ